MTQHRGQVCCNGDTAKPWGKPCSREGHPAETCCVGAHPWLPWRPPSLVIPQSQAQTCPGTSVCSTGMSSVTTPTGQCRCWAVPKGAVSPSGTSPTPRDTSYLAGCHSLARLLGEDGSILCLSELARAESYHLANVLPWGLQQGKYNGPKVLHSHPIHGGVPHGQLCMERLIPAAVQPSSEQVQQFSVSGYEGGMRAPISMAGQESRAELRDLDSRAAP